MITMVSRASRSSSTTPLPARREQPLGRLAHDDEVDVARARVGQRQRHAGNARAPDARRRRARARRAGRAAARSRSRRDSGSRASPSRRTGSRRASRAAASVASGSASPVAGSAARRRDATRSANANGAPCASLLEQRHAWRRSPRRRCRRRAARRCRRGLFMVTRRPATVAAAGSARRSSASSRVARSRCARFTSTAPAASPARIALEHRHVLARGVDRLRSQAQREHPRAMHAVRRSCATASTSVRLPAQLDQSAGGSARRPRPRRRGRRPSARAPCRAWPPPAASVPRRTAGAARAISAAADSSAVSTA